MSHLLSSKFAGLLGLALFLSLSMSSVRAANEIVIGEYGSLTGGTATFGISTDEGVKLALEQINGARRRARPSDSSCCGG